MLNLLDMDSVHNSAINGNMVESDEYGRVFYDGDFEEWLHDNGLDFGDNIWCGYDKNTDFYEFVDSFGNTVLIEAIDIPNRSYGSGDETLFNFENYRIKKNIK